MTGTTQTPRATPVLRLGSQDLAGAAPHVALLQAELRRLQILQPGELVTAGLFDGPTEQAVRRFQWFGAHVPGALSAQGRFIDRTPSRLPLDGVVGKQTRNLLQVFQAQGWMATGLLVRLHFDRLTHVRPNAGFVALLEGDTRVGLCEAAFATTLRQMDAQAGRLGIHLFVNELFRLEGPGAAGVVLPPRSFSAHKIGRAVDVQLGTSATPATGLNPQPGIAIKNAAPRSAFGRFRQHAQKTLKCRYGGDFDPIDAPHFDRQVLPSGSQSWHMHYFFDQLQYRQAMLNPLAIP